MTPLSAHAKRRAKDRGIRAEFIEMILDHADIEMPIGDNCRLFRVHRWTAAQLNFDDRLSRYAVVWSDRTGQVVTVLPLYESRRGRRYRRAH